MTTANMMPAAVPPPSSGPPNSIAAGPSNQPPGAPMMGSPMDTGEGASDGRKAKRELSQSKRAAQNRAAQRAFRQRKEGYIKKLEQQVRDLGEIESTVKNLRSENYLLKEYIFQLQSRLIAVAADCPPPPAPLSVSLQERPEENHSQLQQQPPPAPAPPGSVPTAMTPIASVESGAPGANIAVPGVGTPLEQVAQAVANLGRSADAAQYSEKSFIKRDVSSPEEDSRTVDHVTRPLRAEGGVPTATM